MGQRQTEMFQLSVKYRLPSGYKNDAIGVWYDAKTEVIQYISKLKQFIQEKGISLLAQAFKPSQSLNSGQYQDGQNQKTKQDYLQMIDNFEEDMVNLKRKTKDFNKSVQKLRQAINTHDESIIQDKNILKNVFQDLQDAIINTNEQIFGRGQTTEGQNYQDFNGVTTIGMGDLQANLNSLTINSQGSSNNQMSPFDKRVNAYSKNAFNRSNSRGISSVSGGIQKPPKIASQNIQSNLIAQRSTVAGTQQQLNNQKNFMNEQQDLHPNLKLIRQRTIDYQQTVNQLLTQVNEKHEKVEQISKRIDEQINESLMKFLQTHDNEIVKQFFTNIVLTPTETAHILAKANLQAHQQNSITGAVKNYQQIVSSQSTAKRTPKQSVSPYRQSRKSASREPSNGNAQQFRKTTPTRLKNPHTGTSTSASRAGGNISSHGQTPSRDLGNFKQNSSIAQDSFKQNFNNNTDHIYKELKKSNEKCMEYQVEIRKLKDQVQVYNLQLEDLRIHNNRYQIQMQNYQKQINQFRITNTRTARVTPGNLSAQEIQSPSHRLYGDGQNQIGQAYSSTSYSQDKEEILAEEQELCKRIDLFFQAMKLLQKAVNRKEDISELKVEFETKQRALQKLSKQIQVRINGSKMQIHQGNQDQNRVSIQDNNENQNKKGQTQNTRNRSQSTRAQQTSATRPQVPASSSHRLPSSPLRSKQNALNQQQFRNSQKSQAGPPSNSAKSPKPFKGIDPTIQFDNRQQVQNNNQQSVIYDEIFIQENQVVNLVQSKSFSTQNYNLIQNKQNQNDQTEQLQQAKKQIQDLSQILNSITIQKNELLNLLQGHQKSLFSVFSKFNSGKNSLPQPQLEYLNEIFNTLLRELDLTLKHFNNKNYQPQSGEQLKILKENLVQKIATFEQNLLLKYNELHGRLEKREEEIQYVKKLFIDKLKVLESNFSEIGDHIIANQAQQEQEKLQNQEPESHNLLKRYLTDSDLQEQDEKQLEELINTNSQLYDQINDLKRQFKDYVEPSQHQQVLENMKLAEEKLKKLEIENGSKLQKAFDNLQKEKNSLQEEAQKLKIEKNNLLQEIQKNNQQQMNAKLEQEKKDMLIEQTINEIQMSLKDEIEQKICAQKEAKEKSQIAKQKEMLVNEKEQLLIEKEKILNIYEDENEALKIELQDEIKTSRKLKNMFDEELEEIEAKKQEVLKEKNDLNEEFQNHKNISEKHVLDLESQIMVLQEETEQQRIKLVQQMEIEKVESSKKWNVLQQKIQVIEDQKVKEKQELQTELENKINTTQKIEAEMQVLKDQKQKYDELQIQLQQVEKQYKIQMDLCQDQEEQLQNNLQKINQLQSQYDNYHALSEQKTEEFESQIQVQSNDYNLLTLENEQNHLKIEQLNNELKSQLELMEKQDLKQGESQKKIDCLINENERISLESIEKIENLNLQLQELQNKINDDQESQNQINELEKIIEENIAKMDNQQQQINDLEKQNQLLQSSLENIESKYQIDLQESSQQNLLIENQNKNLNELLIKQEQQFQIEIQNLKNQNLLVEQQYEEQNEILQKLQLEKEDLQNQFNSLEAELKNLKEIEDQLRSENEEFKNQNITLQSQLYSNQSETLNDFVKQKQDLESTIEVLEAQIEKMIEDYQIQQELFEKQIEIEKQQTHQNYVDEIKIKTDSLEQLENQINQFQIQLEDLNTQLEQSKNQVQQYEQSNDKLQQNIENQEEEIKSLITQLEEQKEHANAQLQNNDNNQEIIDTHQNEIQILKNQLEEQKNHTKQQIENNHEHLEIIEAHQNEIQNLKSQVENMMSNKDQECNNDQCMIVIQQFQLQIQKQTEEYQTSKEEMLIEIAQLKEDQKRVDELLLDLDEIQKNQDEDKLESEKLKNQNQQQLEKINILEIQIDDLNKALADKDLKLISSEEVTQAGQKMKGELEMKIVKLKLDKQMIKTELEAKLRLQRDATAELINDLEVKAKLKEEQLEQLAHQMMIGQKPALSSRSKNSAGQDAELEQERQNMMQVMQDLRLQLEKERQESQKLKEQLKDKDFYKQSNSKR